MIRSKFVKKNKEGQQVFMGLFEIFVDNSIARSFNINIDSPSYCVSAISEEDAIEKMKLSDFAYKNREISKVYVISEPLIIPIV